MSASSSSSGEKLKFREPGIRDTVVRSASKSTASQAAPEKSDSFADAKHFAKEPAREEHPILTKIKSALSQSDPAKWEKYGSELDESIKYPKSYDRWEMVYCIDLAKDLLIFRRSQTVSSEYFGAGYSVKSTGQESYFVELRPRSWDPKTLIDPYFRSSLEKDKQFKVLAMGEVAREIYYQVKQISETFSTTRHQETVSKMQELKSDLVKLATESAAEIWQKSEPEPDITFYTATIDGITIQVGQSKKFSLMNYRIVFTKDAVSTRVDEGSLAREVYLTIEEKNRDAALEALQAVLDKAGF